MSHTDVDAAKTGIYQVADVMRVFRVESVTTKQGAYVEKHVNELDSIVVIARNTIDNLKKSWNVC